MPEIRFRVRWPDDSVSSCYSPSLIVKEYFVTGRPYTLGNFLSKSRESLTLAGERVKAKYGFYCTGASAQLLEIETIAARFAGDADARVVVEAFE